MVGRRDANRCDECRRRKVKVCAIKRYRREKASAANIPHDSVMARDLHAHNVFASKQRVPAIVFRLTLKKTDLAGTPV